MVVEKLNRRHGRVKLPKLGWVKFRQSRRWTGEIIRSVTLTREGRHWFISVLVDDGVVAAAAHRAPDAAVGVDRGVAAAIATSEGELIDREFITAGERRRVVALQRRLSRCAKRSAEPGQGPGRAGAGPGAGAVAPAGLLRPDRPPDRRRQRGGGARRPQDQADDEIGERNP